MWVLGLLCLVAVAVALPAPQSSEIAPSTTGPFINIPESSPEEGKEGSSEEKKEGEIFPVKPIPEPPKLDAIMPPVIFSIEGPEFEIENYNPEPSEDKEGENKEEEERGQEEKDKAKEDKDKAKEEKEKESDEKSKEEEDLKPEEQKPAEVILEMNKPSFFANLFSNFPLSWPPNFQLPNFQFPSLPFFGGGSQGRLVYRNYENYPNIPYYRYVLVK